MGRLSNSMARCSGHRPRFRPMSALVLIAIVLIGAACAPSAPAGPVATSAPAVAQPVAPTAAPAQPVANAPAAPQPGKKVNLPVGVDADGNFYRGDPKAPVKFVDFSDFQ